MRRARPSAGLFALLLALLLVLPAALSCARSGGETETPPTAEENREAADTAGNDRTEETEDGDGQPEDEYLPVLRFAVCSDVHMGSLNDIEAGRFAGLFDTANAYCETQTYRNLDAVVVVGDFTGGGRANQMEFFKIISEEHKREETTVIPVMGNHEYDDSGQKNFLDAFGWLRTHVVLNGFHFIAVAPEPDNGTYDESVAGWMAEQLEEAALDDPEKPIFTFQHHPPQGTVHGSGGDASAPLRRLYAEYPQVVNFAGHTHTSIVHPESVWQGTFTAVATGTLSHLYLADGITEGTPFSKNVGAYWIVEVDRNNRMHLMVYDILTGDFYETLSLSDEPGTKIEYWIDCPSDPSTFVYTASRAGKSSEPAFPEGAEITVEEGRRGRYNVTFPQALDDVGVTVYRMVLDHVGDNGRVVRQTMKITSQYYLEPMPETITQSLEGIQAGTTYTITIYPTNAYGKTGKALTAEFTVPPSDQDG